MDGLKTGYPFQQSGVGTLLSSIRYKTRFLEGIAGFPPCGYLVEDGSLAQHRAEALVREVPPAVVDQLDRARLLPRACPRQSVGPLGFIVAKNI